MVASRHRYKLVEAKCLESTNIQKLVSDEFLKLGVKKQSIARISAMAEST